MTLVEKAGAAILEVYDTDFSVEIKDDDSPLTKADLASHRIIVEGLSLLTPDIPIISEESSLPSFKIRSVWDRYWLIDPLDGTKEFVSRNGEFTVNIALIDKSTPIIGVVGVPTRETVYTGNTETGVATRLSADGVRQIKARKWDEKNKLEVVASRHHGAARLEDFLTLLAEKFGELKIRPVGSSLKLCVIAEGNADIYPRLGPTSEWDIAAAHAILKAAGGDLQTISGSDFLYNKQNILNPEFVAVADSNLAWKDAIPKELFSD